MVYKGEATITKTRDQIKAGLLECARQSKGMTEVQDNCKNNMYFYDYCASEAIGVCTEKPVLSL